MGVKNRIKVTDVTNDPSTEFSLGDTFRMPERFKALNHLVYRDLNSGTDYTGIRAHSCCRYKKEDIMHAIRHPAQHEVLLRDACLNIYESSPHFRRLIQYFVMLNDLSYVVSPCGADISKLQPKTVLNNYNKVLKCMEAFQVKSQFKKILTVCLREDVFYGTLWVTQDNITVQRLPSNYCKIASIEGNVYNVSFNMQYFDTNPDKLKHFPAEFSAKYEIYKENGRNKRWVELDSPKSFAIKCTNDIDAYALPPFAGLLPEIYDLEGYKALKLTKAELDNYAILVMKLGLNADGTWQLDFDKA